MNLFSEIRFLLVRATHTSSNAHLLKSSGPSKGPRQLVGIVAVVLGIALAGMLVPGPVRAGAPDSREHDASAVARARAAFLKNLSSHRPMVPSNMAPHRRLGLELLSFGRAPTNRCSSE